MVDKLTALATQYRTMRHLETRLEPTETLLGRLESLDSLESRTFSEHISTDDAVALINSVVFLPEWTFQAQSWEKRFQDAIKIDVTYDARNSNRNLAPDYTEWIEGGARASFVIQLADCRTADDVLRKLITDVIMKVFLHETREFLRYPDTLDAPFHPHRHATMDAWGTPDDDLNFGVA